MMVTLILVTMKMVTKVLIMMTIITMLLPLNDDDNNDRDVTSDKCGVFFPLLSHHDGTVRPTVLRTYGDDNGVDITKKILLLDLMMLEKMIMMMMEVVMMNART